MAKYIRRAFLLILLFLVLAFLVVRFLQSERTPQGETDLRFRQVELPFTHEADLTGSLPFLASAAIDIDGDGQDELFLGGGDDQPDQFFEFRNDRFEPLEITLDKDVSDASHGAAYIDVDYDGENDLFVARESGVWFYENLGGRFASQKLDLNISENTTPLSIGFGDANSDGYLEMYVAGYIKVERNEGETNFDENYGGFSHLYTYSGGTDWVDISKEAGVWRQHNTFLGLFADLNNDKKSDLVIAQDTGKVETYQGNGGLDFTRTDNPSVYSYPMGIAAGDYDNDGLIDLFFSNVGHTFPDFMLRGNLTSDQAFNGSHMLFHNEGDMAFTDRAGPAGLEPFGFAWGTIFADMDLDGYEDILMAQNYARSPITYMMPKYPGKLFHNNGKGGFQPVEKTSRATNYHFGIAPIVSDFNGDGWPDLVWANLAGPSLAYINQGAQSGMDHNWIKVRLPNNATSIGARVQVMTGDGDRRVKQFITSQGMGSDQGRDMIFGLGADDTVHSIRIYYQYDAVGIVDDPQMNTVIEP